MNTTEPCPLTEPIGSPARPYLLPRNVAGLGMALSLTDDMALAFAAATIFAWLLPWQNEYQDRRHANAA